MPLLDGFGGEISPLPKKVKWRKKGDSPDLRNGPKIDDDQLLDDVVGVAGVAGRVPPT